MDSISTNFLVTHHINLYNIYLREKVKYGDGALFIDTSTAKETDLHDSNNIRVKYFDFKNMNDNICASIKSKISEKNTSKYINVITSPKVDEKMPDKSSLNMVLYNGDYQFVMNVTFEKYNNSHHIVYRFNVENDKDVLFSNGWKVYNEKFYDALCIDDEKDYNNLRNNKDFITIMQEYNFEYGKNVISKWNLKKDDMTPYNNFDKRLTPQLYNYDIGEYSSGIFRYINTMMDINKIMFEKCDKKLCDIDSIIEIGSGYGALCDIIKSCNNDINYNLVDIPDMIKISQKFLENDVKIEYGDTSSIYDLCISEYSLCEFTDDKIKEYLNVLDKCSMCFLKINIWDSVEKDKFKNLILTKFNNVFEINETPTRDYPDSILFFW
jgi:hypothetical protein